MPEGGKAASPARRATATAVDALLWLAVPAGLGAAVAYAGGPPLLTLAVVLVAAPVATLLAGTVTGLDGRSPGRLLAGTRVRTLDGAPLGLEAGLRRSTLKTVAGVGSCGVLWLRWAAVALVDTTGRARTPLDARTGSLVLDVRPRPRPPTPAPSTPAGPVNLTAQRLAVPEADLVHVPAARVPTLAEPDPGGWRLVADTGESVRLEGSAVVGRDPEAAPGVRHLVALRSDDGSLSRSHVRVGPVADGRLVLLDPASTNGTLLVRAGASRPVPRGRPVSLLEGDRVQVGDRWLTVHRDTRVGVR